MDAFIADIYTLILSKQSEIAHPNPERAIPIGFLQLFHVVREVVLFPVVDGSLPGLGDAALVEELTLSYLSYLAADTC